MTHNVMHIKHMSLSKNIRVTLTNSKIILRNHVMINKYKIGIITSMQGHDHVNKHASQGHVTNKELQ